MSLVSVTQLPTAHRDGAGGVPVRVVGPALVVALVAGPEVGDHEAHPAAGLVIPAPAHSNTAAPHIVMPSAGAGRPSHAASHQVFTPLPWLASRGRPRQVHCTEGAGMPDTWPTNMASVPCCTRRPWNGCTHLGGRHGILTGESHELKTVFSPELAQGYRNIFDFLKKCSK